MPVIRPWQRSLPIVKEDEWPLSKMVEDKRWITVHAGTRVIFNGEECDFGSLAGNERMMLEFNSLGMLEGSDPFYDGEDND